MKHPFFKIENKNGVAELRIIGGISDWENNSANFTRAVDNVLAEGATDINVYINCYGGSMLEANEIGNQIQRFTGTKNCRLGAIAASAGGYLTTYFDKVSAAPNNQFMIHDPSVHLFISRPEDFDSNKQLYMNLRNDVIARFVKKTSLTTEEIATMMSATTWLNAEQAKAKGFIDSIEGEEEALPEDSTNLFKNYTNLPTAMVAQLTINNQTPKTINMKRLILALGLLENATEDQAIEALNALKSVGVDAIVALAETKKLKKETIQKLANTSAASALEFVNEFKAPAAEEGDEMPPVVPATTPNDLVKVLEDHLKGASGKSAKNFNDYSPAELEELMEKEPKVYDALFNKQFNIK